MPEQRFGHKWSSSRVPAPNLSLYLISMIILANMSLLKLDGCKPTFPVNSEFLDGRGHLSHIYNNKDLGQNLMNYLLMTLVEKNLVHIYCFIINTMYKYYSTMPENAQEIPVCWTAELLYWRCSACHTDSFGQFCVLSIR